MDNEKTRSVVMVVGATGSLGPDIVTELNRQELSVRLLGRSRKSFENAGMMDRSHHYDTIVCEEMTNPKAYDEKWFANVRCVVCVARPRGPGTPEKRANFAATIDALSGMVCECKVPRMLMMGLPYFSGEPLGAAPLGGLFAMYPEIEDRAKKKFRNSEHSVLTIARISEMSEAGFMAELPSKLGFWPCIRGYNPRTRFISSRDFARAVGQYVMLPDDEASSKSELLVGGPQLVTWREFGECLSEYGKKPLPIIDIPLWVVQWAMFWLQCLAWFLPFLSKVRLMIEFLLVPMMLDTTSDAHDIVGSDRVDEFLKAKLRKKG